MRKDTILDERSFETSAARTENDVIEFYDEYAATWDRRFDESPATRHFLERRWQSFLDALGDTRGGVALELGVGTGIYIDRAAQLFDRVVAVDGAANMLAQLRERLSAQCIGNVTVLQANVLELGEVKSASVDLVYFFGLIEHVIQVEHFVNEIARVLRPGGRVIGVTPNGASPWYRLRRLVRGTGKHCSSDRYYRGPELAELFANRGFRLQKLVYWGAVPAGVGRGLYSLLRATEPMLEHSPLAPWLGGITFAFGKSGAPGSSVG